MAEKQRIDPNLLLILAGGGISLYIVNKILIRTGLIEGKGTRTVTNELENPNSPWKPAFHKAAPSGALLIRRQTAEGYAAIIHNAFGIFQDDFNAVMGVFSQLKTKSQVSFLADVFFQKYNEDLLSFLTDGGGIMPWDGFNDTNLQRLTDYVKSLPNYNTKR
jgi:hypothetical protein